ncbi:MAG: hypothetical protein J6Q22_09620 [Prevotella sp.]|nr:hypothetical protein [Prevotella sp.]
MNLDTLFLSGRIDDATYMRYLREFEEQQRHGRGRKAIARIVDGKTYYEMSDKEDYFYGGLNFDDWCLYHPFEDVCDAAAEHLPVPDYSTLVIREVEKCNGMRWIPCCGWQSDEGERWMPSGSMTMPPTDPSFEEFLDDYLNRVEEHPQSAL